MVIKAGTFIHDAQGFVLDRVQTGGVTNMNIPRTQIYELGDYLTVGNVFDIPDLSFDINTIDPTCQIEALVSGVKPNAVTTNEAFNFLTTYPLDIISPFKAGNGQYNIVKGIAVPYLTLDTVVYSAGVKANYDATWTMRGDSAYYIPGSPYYEEKTLVAATFTYNLNNTAIPYIEDGNTFHVLGACVQNPSTGAYQRLFFGTDPLGYSDTASTITTVTDWQAAGYTTLKVVYGSTVAATYPQSVNSTTATKPAAIRSKDVLVYVGASGSSATSTLIKWHGIQNFKLTRKVNLTNTEELGNNHYVSQDYNTVDVTGTITMRPPDTATYWSYIEQITGTDSSHVSGPIQVTDNEVMIQIRDPSTGNILKTFNVPDAQFTLPGTQGKANTDTEVTFDFFSQTGLLSVYNGHMP